MKRLPVGRLDPGDGREMKGCTDYFDNLVDDAGNLLIKKISQQQRDATTKKIHKMKQQHHPVLNPLAPPRPRPGPGARWPRRGPRSGGSATGGRARFRRGGRRSSRRAHRVSPRTAPGSGTLGTPRTPSLRGRTPPPPPPSPPPPPRRRARPRRWGRGNRTEPPGGGARWPGPGEVRRVRSVERRHPRVSLPCSPAGLWFAAQGTLTWARAAWTCRAGSTASTSSETSCHTRSRLRAAAPARGCGVSDSHVETPVRPRPCPASSNSSPLTWCTRG